MKDNEIGEHVECRRKIKPHIHSQRGYNPGHLAPELTSFEDRMKRRNLGATIISTAK